MTAVVVNFMILHNSERIEMGLQTMRDTGAPEHLVGIFASFSAIR